MAKKAQTPIVEPRIRVGRQSLLVSLLVFVIVALVGVTGFLYRKLQGTKQEFALAQLKKDLTRFKADLSRHFEVPTEEPQIAQIEDESDINPDEAFFVNAKKEDVIFVYQEAGMAILYRPETDRIIRVSPVTVRQPGVESDEAPVSSPTPSASTTPIATSSPNPSPTPAVSPTALPTASLKSTQQ